MVNTIPVQIGQRVTRRAVLLAATGTAVAGALAGCSMLDDAPNWKPGDEGLDTVYADAVALAARYESAMRAAPSLTARLRPILDAHHAHAAALVDALGRSPAAGAPSASPDATAPPGQPSGALAALAAAERSAADRATKVCLAASLWRVPLLASIAAARASHAEALS
jgi:hypothetical protein